MQGPKEFELLRKFPGCPNPSALWRPTRNFLIEVERKLIKQTQDLDHCELVFTDAIRAMEGGMPDQALELLKTGYKQLQRIDLSQATVGSLSKDRI